MKPMDTLLAGGRSDRGELHVHAHPDGLYGEIYIDGAKVGRTGLVASIEAAQHVAADEYGAGLTLRVWSQDDAIILV